MFEDSAVVEYEYLQLKYYLFSENARYAKKLVFLKLLHVYRVFTSFFGLVIYLIYLFYVQYVLAWA